MEALMAASRMQVGNLGLAQTAHSPLDASIPGVVAPRMRRRCWTAQKALMSEQWAVDNDSQNRQTRSFNSDFKPLHRPSMNRTSAIMMTKQIKTCADWSELQQFYEQQRTQLNTLNLLALCHRLTQVDRKKQMSRFEDSKSSAFFVKLAEDLVSPKHLDELGLRGAANMLWACGKIGMHPGLSVIDMLLEAMITSMQNTRRLDALSLSQAIWGLAKLGIQPSSPWLEAWTAAALHVMPSMTPQGLSNIAWAIATLQIDIKHPSFWSTFIETSEQTMQQHTTQALSNTAWALAQLQIFPGQEWMTLLHQTLEQKAQHLTMVDLGQILAAMCQFAGQHRPSRHSISFLLEACRQHHQDRLVYPKEMAMILCNLAWLEHCPARDFMWTLLYNGHGNLRHASSPHELSNIIWGIAKLSCKVKASFARAWFKATFPKLSGINMTDAAQMTWSLGVLGWPVPETWMAALQEEAFQLLPCARPSEVLALMQGFAGLNSWPSQTWMDRFYLETVHHLPSYKNRELVGLLSCLAQHYKEGGHSMCRPPSQWLHTWMSITQSRLPTFNSMELVGSIRALYNLGCDIEQPWLDQFTATVNQAALNTLEEQSSHLMPAVHKFLQGGQLQQQRLLQVMMMKEGQDLPQTISMHSLPENNTTDVELRGKLQTADSLAAPATVELQASGMVGATGTHALKSSESARVQEAATTGSSSSSIHRLDNASNTSKVGIGGRRRRQVAAEKRMAGAAKMQEEEQHLPAGAIAHHRSSSCSTETRLSSKHAALLYYVMHRMGIQHPQELQGFVWLMCCLKHMGTLRQQAFQETIEYELVHRLLQQYRQSLQQ